LSPAAGGLPGPEDVTLLTGASVRGTVLVVEDNEDSLEMMRRMLEALGARVVLAPDGEVALRLLSGTPPDLVLCDLMLPLVDGFRVVSRMRSDPRWKRTPVVAVTGRGYESDYEQTWETGFDGHIVKPIDMDTLAHVLERYLPRRRQTARRSRGATGPRR
jgi:two-component system, sensor histidine kinase